MSKIFSFIFIFLINIFISLFPLITSQSYLDDPSLAKLMTCMTLIQQELKSGEPDPTIYSSMILMCFISISDSQAHSFLMGLQTRHNPLSRSDIVKLLDYEKLKEMSPNEIRVKSMELDKALKKFKKIQEDIMGGREPDEGEDYDDYDDDFVGEKPSSINFFSLIPKGLQGIFGVFSNYISLFIIFALVYFFLFTIRKMNESGKKGKKKKNKNSFDIDEFNSDTKNEINNNKSKHKSD